MEHSSRWRILKDVVSLKKESQVALVHGGGQAINSVLTKCGGVPRFSGGRRVTDKKTMEILEQVLSGKINKDLAGDLWRLGIAAVGLSCRDGQTVIARRSSGLGWAGKPVKANPALVKCLLKNNFLPVISPVSGDVRGNAVNVNADEAAASLAVALGAERLIFLTNVCGVLDGQGKSIPVLSISKMETAISSGVIVAGMLPKTEACKAALKGGVKSVCILDGRAGFLKSKGTIITK